MHQAIADGSGTEVSMSARAKAVVTLIVIQLVATTAVIFGRLAEIGLLKRALNGATVTLAEATRSDDRMRTLGVAYLLSLAASGLAWLIWQYRAHRRLRGSGIQNLQFTPGWGVGWWFVPIANLVMPYKAVRELWRAGDLSSGAFLQGRTTRTPIVSWWWAAFLGANLLARFGAGLGSDESIEDLLTRDYVLMVGSGLWIVSGIIAIMIVRGIDDRHAAISSRTVPVRPDV